MSTPDQLFTVGVAAICPAKENSENQNLAFFSSVYVSFLMIERYSKFSMRMGGLKINKNQY